MSFNFWRTTLQVVLLILLNKNLTAISEYEPWGKDADIITNCAAIKNNKSIDAQNSEFKTLISFHQKVISEADGPRSHYYPSSSQYMLIATQKYGFLKGFTMGCDRLMRENKEKWIYPLKKTRDNDFLKLDPVP